MLKFVLLADIYTFHNKGILMFHFSGIYNFVKLVFEFQ